MSNMDRHFILNAAETYGITHPDYLTTAQTFLEAAQTYQAKAAALTQPTLEDVTAKTISVKVDAVLAFAQQTERLTLAARVVAIADGQVETAIMRFKGVLMVELAKPFDKAASKYMAVYDTNPLAPQDMATVATLLDLMRMRDLLATSARTRNDLPGEVYDWPTRVATLPDKDVLARKIPVRTGDCRRDSVEWFNGMLSIPGVRLKWQTPAQQAAHAAALPRESTAYTASASA